MALVMVGLSHKTAPVEMRERIAFPQGETLDGALTELLATEGVHEVVIVSTCNRTEIYADVDLGKNGVGLLTKYLASRIGAGPCGLLGYSYHELSRGAVEHLFKVVCSLDSMVLGEAQILGQVRRAYAAAENVGATGQLLNQLFRQALEVGKRVRSETGIGAQSVSISTAAVTLAERVFDSLKDRHVVILGAGEMAELTARYLVERGAHDMVVVNRTLERAEELASGFGARAAHLRDLIEILVDADIVISSTAAPGYAIEYPAVKAAKRRSRGRSLVLIDIALPRDIDPKVGKLDDVFLYDIDDLNSVIEQGYESRRVEATRAREIIEEELVAFNAWHQAQEVVPTIQQMRFKAERIRDNELARAAKKLKDLTPEEQEVVEAMANSIITKMLHGPFARLRKNSNDPDAYVFTQAARYLFGLDSNPSGEVPEECRRAMREAKARRLSEQSSHAKD